MKIEFKDIRLENKNHLLNIVFLTKYILIVGKNKRLECHSLNENNSNNQAKEDKKNDTHISNSQQQ